jgi:hypothetical protein
MYKNGGTGSTYVSIVLFFGETDIPGVKIKNTGNNGK